LQTGAPPLAVYDNFAFSECAARCSNFYWKQSGTSNCVCMRAAEPTQTRSTANFADASIKRFTPTCAGGANDFGLYQIAPTTTTSNGTAPTATDSGRRLLQQADRGGDSVEGATAVEPLDQSNDTAPEPLDQSNDTAPEPLDQSNDTALGEASNTSSEASEELTTRDISLDDFNNSDTTESDSGIMNETAFQFVPTLCFDVPIVPKNQTEVVCSSKTSTPVPLPRAWVIMNNLNPDAADPCKTWKPAVGSRSISCVNV